MNKSQLMRMKKVRVLKEHFNESKTDMIERFKKDITRFHGSDSLKDLEVFDTYCTYKGKRVDFPSSKNALTSVKGEVHFRSKDYYFIEDGKTSKCYGEIEADQTHENGFYLKCFNGTYYKYTIINETKPANYEAIVKTRKVTNQYGATKIIAKVKTSACSTRQKTLNYDYALNAYENHLKACEALMGQDCKDQTTYKINSTERGYTFRVSLWIEKAVS